MGLQNWWVSSQIKIGRGVDWRTSWKSYGNRDDWSEEGEWQAKICPHWRQCIVSRRAGSESGRATTTTMRQISREISVPKSSVLRIVHDDLSLKCAKKRRAQELTQSNRAVRLQRAKKLLQMFPDDKVDFIWFTDEKVFTVSSLRNPQSDRLYVPAGIKKKQVAAERLLRTRTTFSWLVMVLVGVSKLGFTGLIFVDPGVKVNGSYYRDVRDVLLWQTLLPVMREVLGEFYLSAGQRTRTQSLRYCQISEADNASVHFPRSVASEEPRPKLVLTTKSGASFSSVSISHVFTTLLKQRLLDVWHGMVQSVVELDSAIDEWRVRLRACVRARGGHFEQTLWLRQ